ncbi:MAG: hypothetical protein CSB13_07135 [Chloroflexi bacterium]|nr:MAG: hypothetical protein CSB13_07135 [Chloroflexota bacterium]
MRKTIHNLSFIIVLLTIVVSGVGLFWADGGAPFAVKSLYGNEIELFGNGIYKNDNAFLAPIFKGTDCVMFFISVPFLLLFIYVDKKQHSFKSLLRLTSFLFVVFYYAINLAFGVTFNALHLVYTLLLSICFFTGLICIQVLKDEYEKDFSTTFKATLGLKTFIIISGIMLFVAWLPDIISAHISDKPLSYLENYTTSVTYIIDMGFISPLLFLSLYLLRKHIFYGVCSLSMLLSLSMMIGIILPFQTWFQLQSGIDIPLPELITKVIIFIVLSVFAIYFNQKLYKTLVSAKSELAKSLE